MSKSDVIETFNNNVAKGFKVMTMLLHDGINKHLFTYQLDSPDFNFNKVISLFDNSMQHRMASAHVIEVGFAGSKGEY